MTEKIVHQVPNPEAFAEWHKRIRAQWDGVVHFKDGSAIRIDTETAAKLLHR